MGRAVAAAQRQHSGEWIPVRDANASLDRIAAAAMPAKPFAHHQIGAREGAFNIAEDEPAIIGDVAVFSLQDIRAFSHRCPDRIDHRLQRLVFHVDQFQGAFRYVAVERSPYCYWLARPVRFLYSPSDTWPD